MSLFIYYIYDLAYAFARTYHKWH